MRRYLVVANQTLQAGELRDELREKLSAGPCSFFVLVPDTKAADYDAVAAGGVLPQPGVWWWATQYARPATDQEGRQQMPRSPHPEPSAHGRLPVFLPSGLGRGTINAIINVHPAQC
jgi:hypothetical protein